MFLWFGVIWVWVWVWLGWWALFIGLGLRLDWCVVLFCLSLLYLSVLVGGWYCGRLFVCLGCSLGLFDFVVGFWFGFVCLVVGVFYLGLC